MLNKSHGALDYFTLNSKLIDRLEVFTSQVHHTFIVQCDILLQVRSSDVNKTVRNEHSFMLEFNCQHTSVSNALLRHDRQAKNDDSKTNRRKLVSEAKVS